MAISSLTKVGFAKETTWGSYSTATPVAIPTNPPTFTEPMETVLDEALRGIASKDFGSYRGVRRLEGSMEGPFYPDECGHFLSMIMGSTTASGSGPTTNSFALGVATPSYSVTVENTESPSGTVRQYRYTGCLATSLTLKFSAAEGLFTYAINVVGNAHTTASGVAIGAVSTTAAPFMGWQTTASAGGTPYTRLIDVEYTLERPVELIYTATNSQFASAGYAGPLAITAKATMDFPTYTDYLMFLNKVQNEWKTTTWYGSGSTLREVVVRCTNMDFADDAATIDRSGITLRLGLSMRGLYNVTDQGPVWISIKNGVAGY
jgi:hypothetical protein